MKAFFLDLLFPRSSLTGEKSAWITPREQSQMMAAPVWEEQGSLRARGLQSIDRLFSAASYDDALLRKSIHTFKYKRISALRDALVRLITISMPHMDLTDDPVFCPVPLHWSRCFQRGFNQSGLLATLLGRAYDIPVQPLLRRIRPTGHQAWRKRDERMQAVRGAFCAVRKRLPLRVILVDDLSTTGATMDACAKALKDAGVRRVEGWVIARG